MNDAVLRPQPRLLDWLLGGVRTENSFAYLDGVRGIAVLYVIVGHYSIYDPTGFWYKAVAPGATLGVYLFFLLSSYLLTTLLLGAFRKGEIRSELYTYFRRRFLRIYPMFTVVLIVIYLRPIYYATIFVQEQVSFFEQFFLIHARSIFWAISVEFEFYLVLPFIVLAFFFAGKRGQIVLLVALLGAFFLLWTHRAYNPGVFPNGYPHLPAYLSNFLLGSILAFSKILVDEGGLPRPPVWIANIALIFGALGHVWSLPIGGMLTLNDHMSNSWHLLARDQGGSAFLWGCMFFGLIYGSKLPRRWLSSNWVRLIGIVSYSAYLTHQLVARELVTPLLTQFGFYGAVLGCTLATIALSTCTFLLIERPFIRIR